MEKDMGNQQYTDEFKEEAVRQVLGRGYSVKEVSENLGVSMYSLYKWLQKARPKPDRKKDDELLEAKRENMKLRAALRRVEEERDILKKAAAYSTGHRNTTMSDTWLKEVVAHAGSQTWIGPKAEG
jgi:transposase